MTNKFKTKTKPKHWTKQEETIVYKLYKKNTPIQTIAEKTGRSTASIQNKIRRLRKRQGTGHYDQDHTINKHLINQRFLKQIKPQTILDLYNAGNTQYNEYKTITNDINTKFNTTYHYDALKLIKYYYQQDKHFDLIDADPYGSPYPLLPYIIPLSEKALILTFGELLHKRFKRLDYVKTRYNIQNMQEFTLNTLNNYVINYAKKEHQKSLTPVYMRDWKYIGRIWYKIKRIGD